MKNAECNDELRMLVSKIQGTHQNRHRFHPALQGVIHRMRAMGYPVSAQILSLEKTLLEEAVEAQFDNMPV